MNLEGFRTAFNRQPLQKPLQGHSRTTDPLYPSTFCSPSRPLKVTSSLFNAAHPPQTTTHVFPFVNPQPSCLCPSLYLPHPLVPPRSPRERRRVSDRLNRSPGGPRAPPPRAGDCGRMFNIALQRRARAVSGVNDTALSSLSRGIWATPPCPLVTTTVPTLNPPPTPPPTRAIGGISSGLPCELTR